MDRFAHYGWPFFEPRHMDLARRAESYAIENLSYAHGEDADAICRRLVQDLACVGFLSVFGSENREVRSVAILREILAYHAGLADFSFVMQGLGSGPIALAGTDEQKKKYLAKTASGDAIAAFALSEPDAGAQTNSGSDPGCRSFSRPARTKSFRLHIFRHRPVGSWTALPARSSWCLSPKGRCDHPSSPNPTNP